MSALACLNDPRLVPALILAASVAVLGTAFAFQYIGGLEPCILCYYQRVPYAAAIALAGGALWLTARPGGAGAAQGAAKWLVRLSGLGFLIGAGIAFFHVGVEQHWWAGTESCVTEGAATTLEELEAQLEAARIVRCDQIQWSLFGISMAGYNVLASLGLAAFAFAGPGVLARLAAGRGGRG